MASPPPVTAMVITWLPWSQVSPDPVVWAAHASTLRSAGFDEYLLFTVKYLSWAPCTRARAALASVRRALVTYCPYCG
ncbi:hypothetical protein D3C81_1724350 [compost metagenome]